MKDKIYVLVVQGYLGCPSHDGLGCVVLKSLTTVEDVLKYAQETMLTHTIEDIYHLDTLTHELKVSDNDYVHATMHNHSVDFLKVHLQGKCYKITKEEIEEVI